MKVSYVLIIAALLGLSACKKEQAAETAAPAAVETPAATEAAPTEAMPADAAPADAAATEPTEGQ